MLPEPRLQPSDVQFPLRDPLKWIRVIELLPAAEGIIKLELHNERLFSPLTRYEGVSYTWGNEEPTEAIMIGSQVVYIRPNLCAGLKRLRKVNQSRRLWVDAICIDQRDDREDNPQKNREKNDQVRLMGEIYRRARRVLVWLGEAEGDNDLIFHKACSRNWWKLGVVGPSDTDAEYQLVSVILHRPYWNRTWIVQELLLAKRIVIHYGRYAAGWAAFAKLIFQGSDPPCAAYKWFKTIYRSRRHWHETSTREMTQTLWDNLRQFNYTECKEPKDKIYAFLAISVPPLGKRVLKPNYSSQVDIIDVFISALEVYTSFSDILTDHDDINIRTWENLSVLEALGLEATEVEQRIKNCGGLQRQRVSVKRAVSRAVIGAFGVGIANADMLTLPVTFPARLLYIYCRVRWRRR